MFFFSIVIVILINTSVFAYSNDFKLKNDMIFISGGKYYPLFKIKNNYEFIKVSPFYIDKYPVTNYDFYYFLINNPKWNKNNIKTVFADKNYLSHWDELKFEDIYYYPVINVSWFTANAYCEFYGKRLPKIDEWELVGSSSKLNPIGKNDPEYLQDILNWYTDDKFNYLLNINNMKKNYWGVYGMNGVIWEWVEDFNSVIMLNIDSEGGELEEFLYCGAAATESIDPSDYVAFMRFSFRSSLQANYTIYTLGFRCVKDG